MGAGADGSPVAIDLEELLATRLLVQGNSGSGKSHLLRRLLEGSAGFVQQIVIDPEGDFVSLGEAFGHLAIDGGEYSHAEIGRMAERVRETRASVVLSLEALDMDAQMKCAATFLSACSTRRATIGIRLWWWSMRRRCSRPLPPVRSATMPAALRSAP
jgi:DNA helicase HerA-like ATPase